MNSKSHQDLVNKSFHMMVIPFVKEKKFFRESTRFLKNLNQISHGDLIGQFSSKVFQVIQDFFAFLEIYQDY